MKILLMMLVFVGGQFNSLREKPVVHLDPHRTGIPAAFGGKLLELVNAPATLVLPRPRPVADSQGAPWEIDIRNLGPEAVSVTDPAQFSISIHVGETAHIVSNGRMYSAK